MLYQVKAGYMFGAFDQHGPGSIVELTEQEAAGFLDKLELLPGPEPPPEPAPVTPGPPKAVVVTQPKQPAKAK